MCVCVCVYIFLLRNDRLTSSNVLLGLQSCAQVWLLTRQHFKHQVKYSLHLTLGQQKLTQIFVLGRNFSI